jgi:hypothetical protein
MRKYGLTCDNLISADVVTADGRLLHASEDENADLFWGLRGGGGNFGVVTSFTYRLHPVGPVLAGGLTFAWADAREVLRRHDEFMDGAPDELTTALSLGVDPTGTPGFSLAACWCGDLDTGTRVMDGLRDLGTPVADTIGVVPYIALQSAPDAGFPLGWQHYWKSGSLARLTDDAVDTLLDVALSMPPGASGIGLQGLRGAASRVPVDATAFPHRSPHHDVLILSQWADPAEAERTVAWTREAFERLRPHLDGGVYVNNLGTEGSDRVRAAYGPNYARLAELKRRYDPANVFRLNQNIRPAPETS